MKKLFYLFVMSLIFSACSLKSETDVSPRITYSDFRVNGDSIAHQDTLFVGDTLQFAVSLNGYYNELTQLNVNPETDYITFSLCDSATASAFINEDLTDASAGKYIFKSSIYSCAFPVQIVAKQAKQEAVSLKFSLTSSSELKDGNPCTSSLSFKVVAAKD